MPFMPTDHTLTLTLTHREKIQQYLKKLTCRCRRRRRRLRRRRRGRITYEVRLSFRWSGR